MKNGKWDFPDDVGIDGINKLFNYVEYLHKKLIELIERNDDFLEPFLLYRFPKAILGTLFNILFELDNQITAANSCVDRDDLKFNFEIKEAEEDSPNKLLIFNKLDRDIFRLIKGMEFDIEAQLNFMELFNASYKLLLSSELTDENKLEDKFKNLFYIKGNDKKNSFSEWFANLNRLKNRLFDTGIQLLAGKNAGILLKKYAYVQFEVTTKVNIKKLADNSSKQIINKERIRCFYNFEQGYKPENIDFSIHENWKPEYEYEVVEDGGIISLDENDIVTLETDIVRTTGIQDLIQKGLEQLENEKIAEKAVSVQWGNLGAEAGAVADKFVVTFLRSRYEAEPVLPTANLTAFMHRYDLNDVIMNKFASKYVLKHKIRLGDIKLEFPKTPINTAHDGLNQVNDKTEIEFATICGLK